MTGFAQNLTSIKSKVRDKVSCAREEPHNVTKKGSGHFDGKINMTNVLYVPTLKCSLVSTLKSWRRWGIVVMFDGDSCWIVDNMQIRKIINARFIDLISGLYRLCNSIVAKA